MDTHGNFQKIYEQFKYLSLSEQESRDEAFYQFEDKEKKLEANSTNNISSENSTEFQSKYLGSPKTGTNDPKTISSSSEETKIKKSNFLKPQNEKTVQRGLEEFELFNIIKEKKNTSSILVKNDYYKIFEKVGLFKNDDQNVIKLDHIDDAINFQFSLPQFEEDDSVNFDAISNIWSNQPNIQQSHLLDQYDDDPSETLPLTNDE